jgi:ATP-dependent Clp protease ATP-binding subunit ClpC
MRARPALPLPERIKRATTRTQRNGVFQRFTDRARRVVVLAQEEARLLRHQYVGTEHLLLAPLRQGQGGAAQVLTGSGIGHAQVRERVLDPADQRTRAKRSPDPAGR